MNQGGYPQEGHGNPGGAQQAPGYAGYGLPPKGVKAAEGRPFDPTSYKAPTAFTPRQGATVTLQILGRELTGSAGNSPRAFAVVYLKTFGVHDWVAVGQTGTCQSEKNTTLPGSVSVSFMFERYQELRFALFERLNDGEDLHMHHLIGSSDVVLGRILSANSNNPFRADLLNKNAEPRRPGSIVVIPVTGKDPDKLFIKFGFSFDDPVQAPTQTSEQATPEADPTERSGGGKNKVSGILHKAQNVAKKGVSNIAQKTTQLPTSKRDQLEQQQTANFKLLISVGPSYEEADKGSFGVGAGSMGMGSLDPSTFTNVYISEVLNLHPATAAEAASPRTVGTLGTFPDVEISSRRLNDGDENRPLFLAVYHDQFFVGGVTSTLKILRELVPGTQLVINKKGTKLIFNGLAFRSDPSFADYISKNEVAMNLMVAVDFTASNGDPSKPGTLHHLPPNGPNQYEAIMRATANIVLPYCYTQEIPAYGFGANVAGHISQCFPLTGRQSQYTVNGVEDLIGAYKYTTRNVHFHGPTILSEIVRTGSAFLGRSVAAFGPRVTPYMVLVILTDGVMSDGDTFVSELVRMSATLPMSVVIIGVGNEDFSKMHFQLKEPLHSVVTTAARPTTTFVTMRESDSNVATVVANALRSIPDQVLSYMQLHQQRRPA